MRQPRVQKVDLPSETLVARARVEALWRRDPEDDDARRDGERATDDLYGDLVLL